MTRNEAIKSLSADKLWDIVVIGGGATGLGIAVDAASRGYKTLLLEQYDFAKGTSSKSTKLVHGGVRYLANGDLKLVFSALKERGLIFKNAPHVSVVQSFVIPSYSFFSKMKYLIGLKIYDWMAGKLRIGKSTLLNKTQVVDSLPKIKTAGLQGGIRYYDGQFDDARLAINLAQTAQEQGATVLNYSQVTSIIKNAQGYVSGLQFVDNIGGKTYQVHTKAVVNATGVFVDDILKMDSIHHQNLVRPSQGSHIVIDKSFLGDHDALMIPETSDGRVLFGVPWHDKVLLGTTDTPLNAHQIEPRPLEEELDFILDTAKDYLVSPPTRADIKSIFAGLRPLAAPKSGEGNSTKEISRDHKLIESSSGLITITGGKWTTYRKMGEETVDLVAKKHHLPPEACKTHKLHLHGYSLEKLPGHWQVYGSDFAAIKELMSSNEDLAQKIHPKYDFRLAEVVWAVQNEMACKVEDFLARRIRLLLLDAEASWEAAPVVASTMAAQLGHDQAWIEKELSTYRELVDKYSI
ncbi:glycerol-3-phosphate dehydrogenase/oxidase [Sphingobacterium griseoflavum]|nr:glycerol-3-phosphate dehydrogenase/oxidase [Sphingobacterium griseoflavum]